jgi:hypothetical protein
MRRSAIRDDHKEKIMSAQTAGDSTARRDGRPHVTPLLAIWALGAMWFTTGDNEQKAKNLSASQHCALSTGTGTLTGTDYIIEGSPHSDAYHLPLMHRFEPADVVAGASPVGRPRCA